MTIKQLTTSATRAFHKAGFQLKKHSPEILVVTGVVGTVVSAVMACKATTKVSTILDKTKTNVDAIHECVNNPELVEEYTVVPVNARSVVWHECSAAYGASENDGTFV